MTQLTISVERYEALVRAEAEASSLKRIIADHDRRYTGIDRNTVELLNNIYNKEKDNG